MSEISEQQGTPPVETPRVEERDLAGALLSVADQVGVGVATGVATAGVLKAGKEIMDKIHGKSGPDSGSPPESGQPGGSAPS